MSTKYSKEEQAIVDLLRSRGPSGKSIVDVLTEHLDKKRGEEEEEE